MRWGKSSIPKVILVLLTLAVVSTPILAATTSTASFSTFNSDWNGASELRSVATETDTRVAVERDTTAYREGQPNRTVAFVLSPDSSYDSAGVTRVKQFVRDGGTLVVADDFGPHANDLLRSLNASARLNGSQVRDPRSNYRSPAMPVATNVTNHSLTAGVESLTLNYATVVEPRGATTLINTSEYAYLDADGNDRLGENESLGRYPVATVESVGEGRVVVVSDPSAFVNAMLDRPGNRRFAHVLLARHDRLLLDYSNAVGVPPLALAVLLVRDSVALRFGIGVLAVGALAVWSRSSGRGAALRDSSVRSRLASAARSRFAPVPRSWRSADPRAEESLAADPRSGESRDDARATTDELAAHLERRHPDWDRERAERVASSLERRRDSES